MHDWWYINWLIEGKKIDENPFHARWIDDTLWWTNILQWKDPPCLMGKSTINIYKWPFSIAMLVHQRVIDVFPSMPLRQTFRLQVSCPNPPEIPTAYRQLQVRPGPCWTTGGGPCGFLVFLKGEWSEVQWIGFVGKILTGNHVFLVFITK